MNKIIFAMVALFTVGCASLPPQTEAIHEALVIDAALREATDQCAVVGSGERRLAERERVEWWKRNGSYVLAADYGILQLNWEDAPEKSEPQRAVLAMQLLENIQIESALLLDDWFGDYEESNECEKLFKQVNKGKFDLDDNKKRKKILDTLVGKRQDMSNDAELARSINSRYRKYGRSLFVVEKALKVAGCSTPNIALLRNSWPIEVYDAVCSQKDYLLVKCEWGRCEIKR